jgi:hypothetical protein
VRCAELGERVDERPFLVEEGGNKEIPVHKVLFLVFSSGIASSLTHSLGLA